MTQDEEKETICNKLQQELFLELKEDQEMLRSHRIFANIIPNTENDPLDERVESWCRYYIALQPLDEEQKPRLYQLEAILFAIANNPFLSWKWSCSANVRALRPCVGWAEQNFPHDEESSLALQIFCSLLQYGMCNLVKRYALTLARAGPVLRKLGPEIIVPQATAAKLIEDTRADIETKYRAYKILNFFSRDGTQ